MGDLLLLYPISLHSFTKIISITATLNKSRLTDINPYGEARVQFLRKPVSSCNLSPLFSSVTDQIEAKDYSIYPNHILEEGFFYYIGISLGGDAIDGVGQINSLSFTYKE